MATEDPNIVDPDLGDGTVYETLNLWEDGEDGDLVSADIVAVAECRSTAGKHDTTTFSINGFTTDATRFPWIRNHSSEPPTGKWDETRYILDSNDAGTAITISDEYARVTGIQILVETTGAANGITISAIASGGSVINIDSCIINGICSGTGSSYGINQADADAIVNVFNTIIYDFISGGDSGFRAINSGTSCVVNAYNCTIHNCYYGLVGASITAKNCIIFGCTDDVSSATCDYCATDDNDGTNNVDETAGSKDWDDTFTDYANDDFSLLSTSPLIGAGAVDPSSGLFSDDVIGTTRGAAWDVGAFEYVAPSATKAAFQYLFKNRFRHMAIR